jgi:hypothetical protein
MVARYTRKINRRAGFATSDVLHQNVLHLLENAAGVKAGSSARQQEPAKVTHSRQLADRVNPQNRPTQQENSRGGRPQNRRL